MATIHMTTAVKGSFYDNLTNEIKMRQTPRKQRKGMAGAPLRAWQSALWRDPWRQMGRLWSLEHWGGDREVQRFLLSLVAVVTSIWARDNTAPSLHDVTC